ncbi:transcriptional regulator [Rhodococcus sp. 06-235-1A]|uniref:helix-turn-helix transcriptional regulator n=1 Tax=Rhodococcus sp. 06-235-1A TaxID=2022508 RepID=UPI000B9AA392|nr:helix-turn-helix transcriptional regulator [Rhodococcus sp. 06-235-1A]OZC95428.1 transcriptional regulator [Rhodococcus sp. 06-235-1A]
MAERNRELADFLRRARSQSDPARTGLPADSRVRRVPGLRREEVALLAGVSADYYARLEQGRRIIPSPAVIDALARALDLDAAGRAHLDDLIGAPGRLRSGAVQRERPGLRSRAIQRVRPGLRQLLDALDGEPAMVLGRRTDILATNRMARALFADFDARSPAERNYARWMFLDDGARALFVDWEVQARAAAESLRLELGADPNDRATNELVTQLREASAEFSDWWDQHRVYQRTYGSKRLRHNVVGELTVDYETFTLPGDTDSTLYVYTAEPDSPSHQALDLLASWTLAPPSTTIHPRTSRDESM